MNEKRPLILITNDDGLVAKGIQSLIGVARELGDVVVMAPAGNASAKSHSLTTDRPLRVFDQQHEPNFDAYTCDGTPVDCVKVALEHFCPRRPDLILSGINHGSNASINVLYSGTIGASMEGCVSGFPAIGFSLLNHSANADFREGLPYVREIIDKVLEKGLPPRVSLNVNIPDRRQGPIQGVQVCRQSAARWTDSYERRVDPIGRPYFWLTGKFICEDAGPGTDQWALEHGFISVVPTTPDSTDFRMLEELKYFEK